MPAKTILDIYNSADKAATSAATLSGAFTQEQAAIAAFVADGNDPLDWAQWKQFFFQRVPQVQQLANSLVNWAKQPSPSALAAQKAAPAPAAAAPATPPPPVAAPLPGKPGAPTPPKPGD